MNLHAVLQSQYLAALAMLEKAIIVCPDELWDAPTDTNKFWHIAYHAIFYTHLYLQPREDDFAAWDKARENYNFMGTLPAPPHEKVKVEAAYTKAEILEYLALFRQEIPETVAMLDLASEESGFSWISLNKLELQFYNIRHLQQHTGELCERLGTRAQIDVDWVGKVHD